MTVRARARWSLAGAGVLLGVAVAAVGATATLLGGGPPVIVTGVVTGACALAGVLAGLVPALRRAGVRVLVTCASAAAVALAVVVGLLAAVLTLGRLPVGAEQALGGPLLVGVVVGAVLAGPLARRAARWARAALHGRRRSPDELLADSDMGKGDVEGGGDVAGDLLRPLAESLRREHRLSRVEIWSAPGADVLPRALVVPAAAEPDPEPLERAELALLARSGVAGPGWLRMWLPRLLPDPPVQLRLAPAVHAGRVLALIVVTRAADADAFTGGDERALADVARRLAIVLHNRALDEALADTLADLRRANTDLQASRARLVSAADAERRRIERDLHDGAQQHLVALAVGLRLVRDGDGDAELLDELDRGVRESISALRDLAHGIYPPLLRDSGLPDALRTAATRSPQPVTVRAVDVGRHPEPVEAAVYFCCLEALANAAKHAAGAPVDLTVARADGLLTFEVADRGPGVDTASVAAGAGLQNMADRLGAVGGAVRWHSTPGRGTTVSGSVPLSPVSLSPVSPAEG